MEDAKEVCPTTTQKLLKDGAILVDVRERDEIDALAFDVPSLIIMPMSELESRFAELPKDVPLILACRKGVRSLKATYFLMFHGYTNVTNMKFGIECIFRDDLASDFGMSRPPISVSSGH